MRRFSVVAVLSLVAAACLQALPAAAACPRAEIVAPERGTRVVQLRPVIEWRALPGINRYHVQLESQIPEGRVVSRIDTIVAGTRFVPPAELTDSRAAVKLLVTAACKDVSPLVAELPAWFFVDAAALCPPIEKLTFTGAEKVEWPPLAAATRYEVTFYAMPEGKLIAAGETAARFYDVTRGPAPVLVAVRPRCGAAIGPAAYGFPAGPR
ncbi:MAG: hypothetical protein ACREVR_16785 [Burkholderiales bacterium]